MLPTRGSGASVIIHAVTSTRGNLRDSTSPGTVASSPFRIRNGGDNSYFRQSVGNESVTIIGGVLVDHGRLRAGVAQSSHELLGGGAGLGGEYAGGVAQIVKPKPD
jgi:hypothetical protein